MSIQEKRRPLDRATAERLFAGERVPGHIGLADWLAAGAAPGREDEYAGESRAIAAFRIAAPFADPVRQPRRIKAALARVLTVKVAALCAGAVGVGGVALAAGTGTIPGTSHQVGAATSTSGQPQHSRSGRSSSALPSGSPQDRAGSPPPIARLCRDYIAQDPEHRGRALDEERFRDLVTGTGAKDRDRVDTFCATTLQAWPQLTPSGVPHGPPPGRPGDGPAIPASGWPPPPGPGGDQPGDRAEHRPSTQPSVRPSLRPTGTPPVHPGR